jgi:putative ABC transport system substrate-binding protein
MRRREFIKLAAATTAAGPLAARAQQNRMRRVGVIMGLAENDPEANARVKALRLGMRDLDWVEGRNVQIECRFAEANTDPRDKAARSPVINPHKPIVVTPRKPSIEHLLPRASAMLTGWRTHRVYPFRTTGGSAFRMNISK